MTCERITVTINAPYSRHHGRAGTVTPPLPSTYRPLISNPRNIWVAFANGTGALFTASELVVQP